jgi:predicted aminopeptidase
MVRIPRLALIALLCLLLGACSTFGYYLQAVQGHLQLLASTRPVADLLGDAATPPELRRQLESAIAIRDFAVRELALPDNPNYRSYANLGRPFVVWNVFAAPEFSVELQQWCMLFVGCVNYRGYYERDDASRYAEELQAGGADIYVSGIPAYSTLGFFNDPLLNTFMRFGDQEVARIVFHELAHQFIYAKGDSAFNEAYATTVESEGLRRWLSQSAPEKLPDFAKQQGRREQFHRLIADYREKLRALYAVPLTPEVKRQLKAERFAEMQRAYADLKARWGGYAGYDRWFSQPLNNANLGSIALYTRWVPAFQAVLAQEGGDLQRFYRRVQELANMPKRERAAVLDRLLPEGPDPD